jgi:hypothetical protein
MFLIVLRSRSISIQEKGRKRENFEPWDAAATRNFYLSGRWRMQVGNAITSTSYVEKRFRSPNRPGIEMGLTVEIVELKGTTAAIGDSVGVSAWQTCSMRITSGTIATPQPRSERLMPKSPRSNRPIPTNVVQAACARIMRAVFNGSNLFNPIFLHGD